MGNDLEDKSEELLKKPKKEVGPYFNDVVNYATNDEGCIDLSKIEELEGRYSHIHGNKNCDVLKGPCACGGWH